LCADFPGCLELVVYGQASIVPQLVGGRDLGVVMPNADAQSIGAGPSSLCGELAELFPGGTTFLVRPDMPHKGNSHRIAFLESYFHDLPP
jgi:hypothetical protein